MNARLDRAFFARDARVVARALVGTSLVVQHEEGPRVGRIVETEAYRGPGDQACHARFGVTKRTRTLFLGPGHAYVYFIYGMHECFNVTCLREGAGHAVLIRGVELMSGPGLDGRRGDGPGRLTRALGIDRRHDGLDLTGAAPGSPIWLLARAKAPPIATGPRVGVGYAGAIASAPWRFFERDSRHVSRPPASAVGLGRKAGAVSA